MLWSDPPELEFLSSKAERAKAWRAVRQQRGRRWLFLMLDQALFILLFVWIWFYLSPWIMGRVSLPLFLIQIVLSMILSILQGVASIWIFRSADRRVLRRYLAAQGFPICASCGYNLTGLVAPRCPECGQPFDPARWTNPPADQANHAKDDDKVSSTTI